MMAQLHCEVVALLPESRPPWRKFLFSLGAQSLLVLLALWIVLLRPHALDPGPRDRYVVRLADTPHAINHVPAIPPTRLPAEAELQSSAPQPIKVPADAKPQPRVATQLAPVNLPIPVKAVSLPATAPLLPKPPVRTNVFSTGSSLPATIERAPQKVQTGGFGDPNGIPAHDGAQRRPVNIASLGSFELPAGSGRGNGTGGSHGVSGVVASSGFGNGTATGNGTGRPSATPVQQAGFGDPTPAAMNQTHQPQASSAALKLAPAEILSKPAPAYTEEARKLRIEGEVLLEVVFEASGSIRVSRVVRGLGHGLDESAIQAAEHIRFKPALRDSRPSDSVGILHIVFQLA